LTYKRPTVISTPSVKEQKVTQKELLRDVEIKDCFSWVDHGKVDSFEQYYS